MNGITARSGDSAPAYVSEAIESGVSKRYAHTQGHSGATRKRPAGDAPHVCVRGDAGKQGRVCVHTMGCHSASKKEGLCHTRQRGDPGGQHADDVSQSQRDR